jgi:hypothetical protein
LAEPDWRSRKQIPHPAIAQFLLYLVRNGVLRVRDDKLTVNVADVEDDERLAEVLGGSQANKIAGLKPALPFGCASAN